MTKIVSKLKLLPPSDKFRQTVTQELLNKLYSMGLINSASSLLKAEKLAVSAICRFVGVGACLPSAELCLTPHLLQEAAAGCDGPVEDGREPEGSRHVH